MHRHRLAEELGVRHHNQVAGVGLQQRHAQPNLLDGTRSGAFQRDAIAHSEVMLEQHVVTGDVVLEQVLHAKSGDDGGDEDAQDRHVRVLQREAEGSEQPEDDDEEGHHAPPENDHVGADVSPAKLFRSKARDQPRRDDEAEEDKHADDDKHDGVGVREAEARAAGSGPDHFSVSAVSSPAGASPSAAASPSAGTTASAAGSSSSTLSSRLCTILTTSSSGSTRTVTPLGTLMSDTRSSDSISSRGPRSTSKASGMFPGRHSTRSAWIGWRMSPSPRFTAADSPVRWTGTSTVIFSSRFTA